MIQMTPLPAPTRRCNGWPAGKGGWGGGQGTPGLMAAALELRSEGCNRRWRASTLLAMESSFGTNGWREDVYANERDGGW